MFALYFLIPLTDNEKKKFTQADHEQFEEVLRERFDGLSRPEGEVAGQWVDAEGKLYLDQNRVYMVAVKSIVDGGKVAEVIEIAKRLYRQKSITIKYFEIVEIL